MTTTMIETDSLKFYLARFSFLAVALLLWSTVVPVLYLPEFQNHQWLVSLPIVTMGAFCFYLFRQVSEKVKRVAVGRNKIVIIEGEKNSRFSWPEVKSVKTIPFINLYRLKLRGMKPIYFFPEQKIEPALEPEVASKMHRRSFKKRR